MTSAPIMMDVDTGVDDAAAMALAIGLGVDLVAVSTVAGNVPIDASTDNTLRVLSLLGGSAIPVYRGASRPLAAAYQDASHVHGENGLGNAELPRSDMRQQEQTAPEAIIATAERHAGDVVFVSVGPLTNLAMALSLRPGIVEQIAHVVIMGGAYTIPGNITPYSEFNISTDPDAANQVFNAPWKRITAIGLDVTQQTALTQAMWNAIPEDATGAAGMIRAISERTFAERVRSGFFLHDPLALAVAVDPTLVGTERHAVTVRTDGEHCGQTVLSEGGSVDVALTVDAERFVRLFCAETGIPFVAHDDGLADAE